MSGTLYTGELQLFMMLGNRIHRLGRYEITFPDKKKSDEIYLALIQMKYGN
jgi:hypothetical protein